MAGIGGEGSARTRQVQLVGGTVLGLGALGWFLASVDWSALLETLTHVHWGWVTVAALLMLVNFAMHAARWGILLKDVDPEMDAYTLWAAVSVGFAFNTLLPLRAGNLMRPAVISTRRGIPYTTVLFTAVADLVCDIFGLVGAVLFMIWSLPPEVVQEHEILEDIQAHGTWSGVGALVLLMAIVMLSTRQARQFVGRIVRPIPSRRARAKLMMFFDQLVAGMSSVGKPERLVQALIVTLAVWTSWIGVAVATFKAFALDLPLAGAIFMETALALSMAVPQAPGFLGVFQLVTKEALSLWDAPQSKADGIAMVFWAVNFLPITIIGVLDAYRVGLNLTGGPKTILTDLKDKQEIREPPPG